MAGLQIAVEIQNSVRMHINRIRVRWIDGQVATAHFNIADDVAAIESETGGRQINNSGVVQRSPILFKLWGAKVVLKMQSRPSLHVEVAVVRERATSLESQVTPEIHGALVGEIVDCQEERSAVVHINLAASSIGHGGHTGNRGNRDRTRRAGK